VEELLLKKELLFGVPLVANLSIHGELSEKEPRRLWDVIKKTLLAILGCSDTKWNPHAESQ
jgi:hypothetical protein